MKNFPKYKSRKTVGALKIKAIDKNPKNTNSILIPANKEFNPIHVNNHFMLTNKPKVGDYYVYVTDDGHQYTRSSKKFIKEYGAIKKKSKMDKRENKIELVIIKEQEQNEFSLFFTGKCKEDFHKWFLLSDYKEKFSMGVKIPVSHSILETFYNLPFSMQYGVYVDFFDSVEVGIAIIPSNVKKDYELIINDSHIGYYNPRNEARSEAIGMSNHIYNNNLF